jgi:predicted outer membrane repeat protein
MISSLYRVLQALLILHFAANATIVTTAIDEDDGSLGGGSGISLREAVKYSPVGDTITFDAALSGGVIRLARGEIMIANSITIDGSALPTRVTLSGDKTGDGRTADDTRVINISTGVVVLDSLAITGGYCPTGSAATQGGGIYVNSTTTRLTIRNSVVALNHAVSGGGIYFSGLLNSQNSFCQIQNSTFAGNTATNGGALYGREATANIEYTNFNGNTATGDGGAIWNRFNLNLSTSTLSGNSAQRGGGVYQFMNILTVDTTTLSANSAGNIGGGIYILGNSATVKASTISGNDGGGIYSEANSSGLVLQHTTITGNSASFGSGINSSNAFTVHNSIVARNIGQVPADISGSFSGSNNIANKISGAPPGTPLLAPLGDYGGPTRTMPPLPGSPAIDAGGATTLTTDQRGFSRVGAPDIGAAEYQGSSDLARFWSLDFDGDASPYGTEQALGTDPLISDPSSSRNITDPAINGAGHAILSFGIGAAAPGTRWILGRSSDLLDFAEIYRFDGTADTAAPGITFLRTATGVTVTDTNPPPGAAFYRFEAVLEP